MPRQRGEHLRRGVMVADAIAAARQLRERGVLASVFAVTSADRCTGACASRFPSLRLVGADEENVPRVGLDGHSTPWPFSVRLLVPQIALGVDDFGQSGARQASTPLRHRRPAIVRRPPTPRRRDRLTVRISGPPSPVRAGSACYGDVDFRGRRLAARAMRPSRPSSPAASPGAGGSSGGGMLIFVFDHIFDQHRSRPNPCSHRGGPRARAALRITRSDEPIDGRGPRRTCAWCRHRHDHHRPGECGRSRRGRFLAVYTIVPLYCGLVFSSSACVVATALSTGCYIASSHCSTRAGCHAPVVPRQRRDGGVQPFHRERRRYPHRRPFRSLPPEPPATGHAQPELERANDQAQLLNAEIQRAAQLRVWAKSSPASPTSSPTC